MNERYSLPLLKVYFRERKYLRVVWVGATNANWASVVWSSKQGNKHIQAESKKPKAQSKRELYPFVLLVLPPLHYIMCLTRRVARCVFTHSYTHVSIETTICNSRVSRGAGIFLLLSAPVVQLCITSEISALRTICLRQSAQFVPKKQQTTVQNCR